MKINIGLILILLFLKLSVLSSAQDSIHNEHIFPNEYLDTLIQNNVERYQVPGAIVSIVKDGKIVFNNGYGYADVESRREVDTEKTVFRVASISKPFTCIAILQLVEQGKLSLKQDIRPILREDFDLDYAYPLSVHHIMTHTAGFDYSTIGSQYMKGVSKNYKDGLSGYLPKMVINPGTLHWYSNDGFGILGYLIEKLSGQSYEAYMQEHILAKLGMDNSTFLRELPDSINNVKAETYGIQNGEFVKEQRQFLGNPAASTLESTGRDMALFMMAILDPNILERKEVLSKEMHKKLTTPQYNPGQSKNAIGYAFFLGNRKNNDNIEHGGGTRGFLSNIEMFPELGIGIFCATNNRYGSRPYWYNAHWKIADTIVQRKSMDMSWLNEDGKPYIDIEEFVGTYKNMRYTRGTFEKAEQIVGGNQDEVPVSVIDRDTLQIGDWKFVRQSNLVFKHVKANSEYTNGFTLDESGRVAELVTGQSLMSQFEKIPWYKKAIIQQIILGLCFFVFLFQFFRLVITFVKKQKKTVCNYWEMGISSIYLISFVTMLLTFFVIDNLKQGVPMTMKVPMILMTVVGVLSLFFPVVLWNTFKSTSSFRSKAFSLITVCAIVWISIYFWQMNLIGMKW